MEPTAKSNKTLHILVITSLLLPVLWSIGVRIYNGTLFINEESIYWYIIRMLINCSFIFLVYQKMYGILLFLITSIFFNLLSSITSYILNPNQADYMDISFTILYLFSLGLMIMLLLRKKDRFFNLDFNSKQVTLKKTYHLIRIFNVIGVLVQITIACFILLIYNTVTGIESTKFFELLMNPEILMPLIALITVIIGFVSKPRFQNLTFAICLIYILNLFRGYSVYFFFPFTKNWSNPVEKDLVIIGCIVDSILLILGTFLFFIIRIYFKEKAELKNQFGREIS